MRMRGIMDAGWLRSAHAVLAVWALYVLVRLALQPVLGWHPASADDWTRALQVRALLDGQAWFDVTQYRMAPPAGFNMHWSRLVDLPLAGLSWLFGETAAFAIVPLLWLLPALLALRAIMLRLGFGPLAMGFGLAGLPLFPLLPGVFAPFAIDHHTAQAVLGVICAALALQERRSAAVGAGIAAAAWVVISLEGLPLVAVLAGLYGLRYLWAEQRLLGWFLGALAFAAPLLSLLTRPLSAMGEPFCDIMLPAHMAGIAIAFLGAAILPRLPRQYDVRWRLSGLVLIACISLAVSISLLGQCAADPMGSLDPLLQEWWHGYVREGLPVWRQTVSAAMVLLWIPAVVAGGWWVAGRNRQFDDGRAMAWALCALFALAAGMYSLLLFRAGVLAQLLAIPFAAQVFASSLPRARALTSPVPRILATLACFGLATPMLISAMAKPFDAALAPDPRLVAAQTLLTGRPCDYAQLARVAPGLIFAPFDKAPEILGLTSHNVAAASYHRNQAPMRAVIAAFTGPVADAERIVRASGADYVLVCPADMDLALYRTAAPDNLANAAASGADVHWLAPVTGFEGSNLRLYRVR